MWQCIFIADLYIGNVAKLTIFTTATYSTVTSLIEMPSAYRIILGVAYSWSCTLNCTRSSFPTSDFKFDTHF